MSVSRIGRAARCAGPFVAWPKGPVCLGKREGNKHSAPI